uniref:Gp65 protein n=1 Tax=Enterobacteria phage T4 TaxID=10665 RepID=Q7Y4H6_BPT4|nr:gp65 protein - phage T4 [Escherichia phage T4]CAA33747.1 unnamed protein product [Tequatrovirus T4]
MCWFNWWLCFFFRFYFNKKFLSRRIFHPNIHEVSTFFPFCITKIRNYCCFTTPCNNFWIFI